MTVQEQAKAIAKLLDDKKAEDIRLIHVGDRTIIADYFVVCSGRSVPHVKALCDEVDEHKDSFELTRLRTDGYNEGRWIVIDFGTILVHIFHPDERAYYNIERLWEGQAQAE